MAEQTFQLVSNYQPTGDQPQAIARLVEGVERGDRCQTLLGVTGSGKTFTMANVIAKCNRPTLVLAHNKTLAAQLCTEFRSFFPENAVLFLNKMLLGESEHNQYLLTLYYVLLTLPLHHLLNVCS